MYMYTKVVEQDFLPFLSTRVYPQVFVKSVLLDL